MLDESSSHKFYNILIIDDEPFVLDIFSHYLANCGFNTQAAANDTEALTYLNQSNFDLILTDVYLKNGSFSNLIKTLKQNTNTFSDIPIIAVTGASSMITTEQQEHLLGVLEKPFTPDDLIDFIQSKLNWKIV